MTACSEAVPDNQKAVMNVQLPIALISDLAPIPEMFLTQQTL